MNLAQLPPVSDMYEALVRRDSSFEGLFVVAVKTTGIFCRPTCPARVRRPAAVRAVGRANGDNRIAILIPCHRVVGADGKLCGYGGQLWRKQALLDWERRNA